MLDLRQDYFTLFGLPRTFRIDADRLEKAYLDLQGKVHPDRFAHLSDAEKRLSMQWATHANGAFRTLRQPLTRSERLTPAPAQSARRSRTAPPEAPGRSRRPG